MKKGVFKSINHSLSWKNSGLLKISVFWIVTVMILFTVLTVEMSIDKSKEKDYLRKYGSCNFIHQGGEEFAEKLVNELNKENCIENKWNARVEDAKFYFSDLTYDSSTELFVVDEDDFSELGKDFIIEGNFPKEKEIMLSTKYIESYKEKLGLDEDVIGQEIKLISDLGGDWELYTISGVYNCNWLQMPIVSADNGRGTGAYSFVTMIEVKDFNRDLFKLGKIIRNNYSDDVISVLSDNLFVFDKIVWEHPNVFANISLDSIASEGLEKNIIKYNLFMYTYVYDMQIIPILFLVILSTMVAVVFINNNMKNISKYKVYGININIIRNTFIKKYVISICSSTIIGGIIGLVLGNLLFNNIYAKDFSKEIITVHYPIIYIGIIILFAILFAIIYFSVKMREYKKVSYVDIKSKNKKTNKVNKLKVAMTGVLVFTIILINVSLSRLLWSEVNDLSIPNQRFQFSNSEKTGYTIIPANNTSLEEHLNEYVSSCNGDITWQTMINCIVEADADENVSETSSEEDSSWQVNDDFVFNKGEIVNATLIIVEDDTLKEKLEENGIKSTTLNDGEAIVYTNRTLTNDNYNYYNWLKTGEELKLGLTGSDISVTIKEVLHNKEEYSEDGIMIIVNENTFDTFCKKNTYTGSLMTKVAYLQLTDAQWNELVKHNENAISFVRYISDSNGIDKDYVVKNIGKIILAVITYVLAATLWVLTDDKYRYDGNKKTLSVWLGRRVFSSIFVALLGTVLSFVVYRASINAIGKPIMEVNILIITFISAVVINIVLLIGRIIYFLKTKDGVILQRKIGIIQGILIGILTVLMITYVMYEITTSRIEVTKSDVQIQFFSGEVDEELLENVKDNLISEGVKDKDLYYVSEIDLQDSDTYGEMFVAEINANIQGLGSDYSSSNNRCIYKLDTKDCGNIFSIIEYGKDLFSSDVEISKLGNESNVVQITLYGCTYGKSKEEIVNLLKQLDIDATIYTTEGYYMEEFNNFDLNIDLSESNIQIVEDIFEIPEGLE